MRVVYWTWPGLPLQHTPARAQVPNSRNGRARWRGALFPTNVVGGLLPWPWRHPPVTSWINTHRRMRPCTYTPGPCANTRTRAYERSDVCVIWYTTDRVAATGNTVNVADQWCATCDDDPRPPFFQSSLLRFAIQDQLSLNKYAHGFSRPDRIFLPFFFFFLCYVASETINSTNNDWSSHEKCENSTID